MKWNRVILDAIQPRSCFALMKYALRSAIHLTAHFVNALRLNSSYCYALVTPTAIRLMAHFVTRLTSGFALMFAKHGRTAQSMRSLAQSE